MRNPGDSLSSSPPEDSSQPPVRDVHSQLPGLRIAPLREPVPRRIWNAHFPLKPEITAHSAPTSGSSATLTPGGSNLPDKLPTLAEFVNAARTSDTDLSDKYLDTNIPPPPKTILPAFINLQAVEKLPYLFEDTTSVKRRRLDVSGDHFTSEHLQLPIPQAQNEKKPPPFGPFAILNGLNEPPPNAALFPPIESGSLPPILARRTTDSELTVIAKHAEKHTDKRELRLEKILDPINLDKSVIEQEEPQRTDRPPQISDLIHYDSHRLVDLKLEGKLGSPNEPLSPKTRGRSRRNLRKWTEQETTDLLKGVVKCGIGNWTAILQQPELNFNKRSAANLKDRFRVCCPWAYGAADPNEATKQIQDTLANALMNAESLTSGVGGKILLPDPRPKDNTTSAELADASPSRVTEQLAPSKSNQSASSTSVSPFPSSKFTPTQSLKSKSTLSSLGISEPYFTIKSKRRSRRPFTPAEDEALLKGYAVHGFQWTLIQQDKHLNLSHRRATDLRDRFRTKFPNAYREGGSVSGGSIGPLRRENSNDNKPFSADVKTKTTSPLKETPHSVTIPPPVVSTSASSVNLGEMKRKTPLSETSGLTSIISLLPPPPPPLAQQSMSLDSSGAATSGTNGGGQGMIPSFSSSNSNQTTSFSSIPVTTTPSAGTTSTSWGDNTLPPLNWDDIN